MKRSSGDPVQRTAPHGRLSRAAPLIRPTIACAAIEVSSARIEPSIRPSTSTLVIRSLSCCKVLWTRWRSACPGSALVDDKRSSGPFAEWGRANTTTLNFLEKQINEAGGIGGKKLKIVIYDDGAKPAEAANALRKLAGDDKVLAIAGPLTSSACEVTFPVANEMKIVSTSQASSKLIHGGLRYLEHGALRLVRAALLHDVGKAFIARDILDKQGKLTVEEINELRQHPLRGHQALKQQGGFPLEMLDVVLHHHEFLDGSGYPDGLRGEKISDIVRLITIVDVYSALVEKRAYRLPFSRDRAFAIMESMGSKLDQQLLQAFRPVAMGNA